MARIKDMTGGIGAGAVLECVGTSQSMTQALRSTRPGRFVGVPYGLNLAGEDLLRFADQHRRGWLPRVAWSGAATGPPRPGPALRSRAR